MKKISVVIIEDDPMVAEITREFMKADSDFSVIGVAASGKEAIALIESRTPDLVLLDYFLPDFNGNEVIKRVRGFNRTTDFIIITAAKEVPLVQECFRLGIRDYLIKPYMKHRFIQALSNYKHFKATLDRDTISQEDLDKISNAPKGEEPKKGFSPITEEKILEILRKRNDGGITAEEIASAVGITTVSARRYLKLFQDKQIVACDLIYGKQGRPTYIFRALQ